MGGSKRWVRMAPHAEAETGFLIARATGDQSDFIGRQVGGRVGHILFTEDLAAQKARMQAAGVQFREDLRHEAYGVVAVFEDLHGALWDLIQPV